MQNFSLNFPVYYRPQRSWGKVMFLQVCVILFTGGCLPQCMLGYTPWSRHPPEQTPPPRADTRPWSRHPLGADPPEQTPPGADTPPGSTPPGADTSLEQTAPRANNLPGACWKIRSTRGQYASYWNAILFFDLFGLFFDVFRFRFRFRLV